MGYIHCTITFTFHFWKLAIFDPYATPTGYQSHCPGNIYQTLYVHREKDTEKESKNRTNRKSEKAQKKWTSADTVFRRTRSVECAARRGRLC